MLPEWTVIGFSGHRKLADAKVVATGIHNAFEHLSASGCPLATVSSAASGADTLFVEEATRRNLPYLLILPFSKDRFQQDFSPADWQRVVPLIDKATRVEEISGEESKEGAYMETGIVTVDRADAVIVVWNGKPAAGLGGTGDVVAYARELKKPLIIIDPDTGQMTTERLVSRPASSLPPDWKTNIRDLVIKHFEGLDKAAEADAPKSRLLGLRIILFQLFASAIGFIALAFEIHGVKGQLLDAAELLSLGFALVLFWQHRKKHHEWLKNRISAEICRSFLSTWELPRRADHFPKLSIQGFEQLCRDLRLIRTLDKRPSSPLEAVRDQYLHDRVENQIAYFSRHSQKARAIYQYLKVIAFLSTAAAILFSIAALTTSILREDAGAHFSEMATKFPKYLSLLLPLVSAAIFSLLIIQDYSRRAVRYGDMVVILEESARRLKMARTWNSLTRIVTETEETLLQEVVEWHSFRQFTGEPH
jgi:hypothetical protein